MGVKISQLPAVSVPALTDVFPIVQAGVTYKETCTQLAALISTDLQASGDYVLTSSATGQTITTSALSTATPNNTGLLNIISNSVLITSGTLNGGADVVSIDGASGGNIAGLTGVAAITGTISSMANIGGVTAAVQLTNATINAGSVIALAAGWTATGTVQTNMSNTAGIGFNNESTDVLGQQIFLNGDATYLMTLTNATTYFKTSGTSAGSWGNGTPPTPSKVLAINVGGTAYYLPLVAQNS